jgi:5,10-methenyltetrahydromethanopterin hydrogenase
MPRPGFSPPAPFVVPLGGDLEVQMAAVANAVNRKADVTSIPSYSAIHLTAPDGSTWMVSVDNTGALITMHMPR